MFVNALSSPFLDHQLAAPDRGLDTLKKLPTHMKKVLNDSAAEKRWISVSPLESGDRMSACCWVMITDPDIAAASHKAYEA